MITGNPVTFSVKVTSDDKAVNDGQVLFKINGKTLRDNTGKVLYTQVEKWSCNINIHNSC